MKRDLGTCLGGSNIFSLFPFCCFTFSGWGHGFTGRVVEGGGVGL